MVKLEGKKNRVRLGRRKCHCLIYEMGCEVSSLHVRKDLFKKKLEGNMAMNRGKKAVSIDISL